MGLAIRLVLSCYERDPIIQRLRLDWPLVSVAELEQIYEFATLAVEAGPVVQHYSGDPRLAWRCYPRLEIR